MLAADANAVDINDSRFFDDYSYPARARRACALRALGLLLADGALTVGRGETF